MGVGGWRRYPEPSSLKRRACLLRVSGGSWPYTTQHRCGVRRSMASRMRNMSTCAGTRAAAAHAQRKHSASTAQAQRKHSASTAQAQRKHSASTAHAQRTHSASTAQAQRTHSASTSHAQRNQGRGNAATRQPRPRAHKRSDVKRGGTCGFTANYVKRGSLHSLFIYFRPLHFPTTEPRRSWCTRGKWQDGGSGAARCRRTTAHRRAPC